MTHHRRPEDLRSDLGPAIRRMRGEVVVDDAPDPDSPNRTIRRARNLPGYALLHRRGVLSDAEREACDRYAITSEAETGAKQMDGNSHIRAPGFSGRGHPTMSQVQAAAVLRNAHAAVGNDGAALLRLYIRDGLAMSALAQRRREDEKVTNGRVLSAIRRLAEHWGME